MIQMKHELQEQLDKVKRKEKLRTTTISGLVFLLCFSTIGFVISWSSVGLSVASTLVFLCTVVGLLGMTRSDTDLGFKMTRLELAIERAPETYFEAFSIRFSMTQNMSSTKEGYHPLLLEAINNLRELKRKHPRLAEAVYQDNELVFMELAKIDWKEAETPVYQKACEILADVGQIVGVYIAEAQRAKDAFQQSATDYIVRSLDDEHRRIKSYLEVRTLQKGELI